MTTTKKIPTRLFKYRQFSHQTLNMLVTDQVYFADPSTFNDPLDSKPALEIDVNEDELENILFSLVEKRVNAEMTSAAKTIRYRGPKTHAHILRHSRLRAKQLVEETRYDAGNPFYEFEDPLLVLLAGQVEQELLKRYDKGIFSLAKRANCPLMWSHYGDQHKGICLGYSVPDHVASSVHKVQYGGRNLILTSQVSAMLKGNESAREKIDNAVLLRKAKDWQYEKEWRVIGDRYLQDTDLELEEVVFGLRCSLSVKYTVWKALQDRDRSVKFYEICQKEYGRFLLQKRSFYSDELFHELPRRSTPLHEVVEAFKAIDPNHKPA